MYQTSVSNADVFGMFTSHLTLPDQKVAPALSTTISAHGRQSHPTEEKSPVEEAVLGNTPVHTKLSTKLNRAVLIRLGGITESGPTTTPNHDQPDHHRRQVHRHRPAGRGSVGRPDMSLSIRKTTYRGEEGYLISGTNKRGQRVSIFTRKRDSAERIKAKQNAGQETTIEDFS